MRKLLVFIASLLSLISMCLAQAPSGIHYQSVVRDNGVILPSQNLDFRFSLRKGAASGTILYQEIHALTTSSQGLIHANIGQGAPVLGSFQQLPWSGGDLYLQVEVDFGNGYQSIDTSPLQSVPYSFFADKAHMAVGDLTDVDTSGLKMGSILKWNGNQWVLGTDVGEIYSAGSGISLNGGLISNTGDLNPMDDITQNTVLGGDLYGNLPQPEVRKLRGREVSSNAPNVGEILKWGGSAWVPAKDETSIQLWDQSGSSGIYYPNGSVGIGLSSPSAGLHVSVSEEVLFGSSLTGSGPKLMWVPTRSAFRAGEVAPGIYASYWDADSLGQYSAGFGYRTRAKGLASWVAGYQSQALGNYSAAIGHGVIANAPYAIALNRSTKAEGLGAFAAGYLTKATGVYAAALGRSTKAQAFGSLAVGRYNVGGGNANSWITSNTDPVFEVGIGSSQIPANALTVYKAGLVKVHTRLAIGNQEQLSDGGSYTLASNAHIVPEINGGVSLGSSTRRWNTIFAVNGTINTSDLRDKEDVRPLKYGLTEVMKLKPVSFTWRSYPEQGNKLGLIAQEVQGVLPEVVVDKEWIQEEGEGVPRAQPTQRLGMYYTDIIPVLIKATQEQQLIIEYQEDEIQRLKREVIKQEARLADLEQLLFHTLQEIKRP
ncbi:MAG: tail fiber domain-containing protein [Bacteroidota bacterium]